MSISRRTRTLVTLALLVALANLAAAPASLRLPAFPVPDLTTDVGATRLLRELHHAGLRGFASLETSDGDYALIRKESVGGLTAWLEALCAGLEFDLRRARNRNYDGTVFARLLAVASSIGSFQSGHRTQAIPIGVALCQRAKPWGELPPDGAEDAYVILATEDGMMIYDPPTRQLSMLTDFPNKGKIRQVRF